VATISQTYEEWRTLILRVRHRALTDRREVKTRISLPARVRNASLCGYVEKDYKWESLDWALKFGARIAYTHPIWVRIMKIGQLVFYRGMLRRRMIRKRVEDVQGR
jgi:hypothetical protein